MKIYLCIPLSFCLIGLLHIHNGFQFSISEGFLNVKMSELLCLLLVSCPSVCFVQFQYLSFVLHYYALFYSIFFHFIILQKPVF